MKGGLRLEGTRSGRPWDGDGEPETRVKHRVPPDTGRIVCISETTWFLP